jgi:thiol-disulfide isomerase/thioredoxin
MKKFLLLFLLAGTTVLAQETIKFSGKITSPNSDKITLSGGKFNRTIAVAKDGTFSDTFDIPEGMYQFFDGGEYTSLYLKNGFDLYMTLDTKEFDETIKYKGKGADENNFLAEKALEEEKLSEKAMTLQSNPDALMKMVKDYNESLTKRMEKLDPGLKKAFEAEMKAQAEENAKMQEMMMAQKAKAAEMIGKPSPSFDYENHKGGKTKLEDLRGKYVYIDMWATWCGPCIREIPSMKQVEEKYHGKNIEFVSISIDAAKDHEKWKKFVTDRQMGGVQLYADKDWSSAFAQAYGVNSIPRFILIDPKGNVVDADAPRPSDPALVAKLDSLLK